jgi:hypothetical protein
LVTGQELTCSWAHHRGYGTGDQCPCGGAADTYAHRLLGCTHYPPTGQSLQLAAVHQALEHADAPAHDEYRGVVCKINGASVAEDTFQWLPDQPVYTDGSCKYATDPQLTISAAAAVQVLADGSTRTVTTDIARTRPQSAVFAEHVALFLAAYYHRAQSPGVHVIADCQAIITGFHQDQLSRQIWRFLDASA